MTTWTETSSPASGYVQPGYVNLGYVAPMWDREELISATWSETAPAAAAWVEQ